MSTSVIYSPTVTLNWFIHKSQWDIHLLNVSREMNIGCTKKMLGKVAFLALASQIEIIVDERVLQFITSKNGWSKIMNFILVIDLGCSIIQIEYAYEQNHIWNVLLFRCYKIMKNIDAGLYHFIIRNIRSQTKIDRIYCDTLTQNMQHNNEWMRMRHQHLTRIPVIRFLISYEEDLNFIHNKPF